MSEPAPEPDRAYALEGLPLSGIRPGTTLLVAGPAHGGTRELGLRMLSGGPDEGAIIVTTDQRSSRVVDDCERAGIEIAADRTAILDCVGDEGQDVPARVLPVSGPSDLTGIGMRFSDTFRGFKRAGIERVRTGTFSVSTLLTFGEFKSVSRFVHTLAGRIDGVGGLGVLLVNPTTHDERVVGTLAQFCGGRIDVRETDDGHELRTRGLADQPREWTPFDPLVG